MPHVVVERLRSAGFVCQQGGLVKKKGDLFAGLVLEGLDILAGLLFLVGSIYFLPELSQDIDLFFRGCAFCMLGSVIYLAITAYTTAEALNYGAEIEIWENAFYFIGSGLFTIGVVLYWPNEHQYEWLRLEHLKDWSIAQYLNLMAPEYEGCLLFIAGSFLFALGALANIVRLPPFEVGGADKMFENLHLMAWWTTLFYMLGALLFFVGSVCMLPELHVGDALVRFGIWCFIFGSVCYVLGGILNFGRLILGRQRPDFERSSLLLR